MNAKRRTLARSAVSLFCSLAFVVPALAQKTNRKTPAPPVTEKHKPQHVELSETQLPPFAISLVISLANDARSYTDLALRPRVIARAADVLWEADNVTARDLFKRAWEAAEKGDAAEVTIKTKDNPPAMALALRRMSGRDLRFEILNLIARRDRELSEEYFAKLKNANEGDEARQKEVPADNWFVSEAVSKRLQVAKELLKNGQTERALEFALPVLNQVNSHTISFLSELRVKDAAAADRTFALLLAQVELDPAADANTVSGLSSYVFTPGVFVTFQPMGGVRWQQPDETTAPPTDFPAALRSRFFDVAARILLRPIAAEQSGRAGREETHNVIKRLLPFFEQHAPDIAVALRARLVEFSGSVPRDQFNSDFAPTPGIGPEPSAADTIERTQERIDRAKTAAERDMIYAGAALSLLNHGDLRARDMADKIENVQRRTEIRQNVDFEFVQRVVRKKDAKEALRLVQSGKLSNTQRAAAYIDIARVMREAEPQRAAELLEDAVREIRRIEGDKSDRAVLPIGVGNQLLAGDRVRAWEITDEVVKEVNRLEGFNPEHKLVFPLMTRSGVKFIRVDGEHFSLASLFRELAKDDLYRGLDLAKSFKYEAARATATLAIASSILQREKK